MSDLPPLPAGWRWVTLYEIVEPNNNSIKAGPFCSTVKKEFYVSHGYKIYGQEQVIRGDPFYGNYYIDYERYQALNSCSVKPGDILLTLVGTIGRVLVLPEGIEPGIINPRLLKITVDKRIANADYLKQYLESISARHYFSRVSHGGTMEILNRDILRVLPIPLPPISEQIYLKHKIMLYLQVIRDLDIILEQNTKNARLSRQSVLKTAFEGKLVSKDPNDEPSEVLLQRIKQERLKFKSDSNKKNNN